LKTSPGTSGRTKNEHMKYLFSILSLALVLVGCEKDSDSESYTPRFYITETASETTEGSL